ncbi:MAG TPA: M4 family metallopeptidase [Kofleriaceae bacterium]|nr:M4 family metallopeptidase [Kofleriaceae bacterium]
MKVRGLIGSMVALAASCTAGGFEADDSGASAGFRVERMERSSDGTPYFASGALGRIAAPIDVADVGHANEALASVLPQIAEMLRVPASDLVATRIERDSLGMTHVRMAQRKDGLRVVGGDVVLHLGADNTVRSVTSNARDRAVSAAPTVSAADAAGIAIAATAAITAPAPAIAPAGQLVAQRSELTYVIATGDGELYLAWEIEVTGTGGLLLIDRVYVDAHTGRVVDRRPRVYTARNRAIYDGEGKTLQNITNPPLLGTETSPPVGDPVAIAAFTNTGATYDCYQELFQRDSYNGAGGALESVVHVLFQQGPGGGNNAAWLPQPDGTGVMVYGDGDNNTFRQLAYGYDVTTHEVTHGVTDATADLAYMNESGALNEGMSDIMAAVCEAWRDKAVTADAWLIGEDVYTPAVPGDALRYMTSPTRDGQSRDYYPERYTGTADNGGVHLNSGIPNLAFYLLSTGGKHPRNKTNINVQGIGIDRAGAIFQRALTKGYFMANTTLEQARASTEQVAQELYPGCTQGAVSAAWAAVGVGAAPTPDAVPPMVQIVSPAAAATVTAGFDVQVTATDEKCILKIDLAIDGVIIGSAGASPVTFPTSPTLAPGGHTITVTTYDTTNQTTATVMVTVAAPGEGGVCTTDEQCADDETCVSGNCRPDPGGCGCATSSRRGAAGSLVLALLTAFALRRRRPRR